MSKIGERESKSRTRHYIMLTGSISRVTERKSCPLASNEARATSTTVAKVILQEILERRSEQWVSAYEIAIIYCLIGDADNAFRWLTQAEREHAVGFTFVRVDPRLEALRDDPRFKELVRGTDKTIP